MVHLWCLVHDHVVQRTQHQASYHVAGKIPQPWLSIHMSEWRDCVLLFPHDRLDVWNLIPGEGSADVVKAMVKAKIQV